jgi:hypothetical protein
MFLDEMVQLAYQLAGFLHIAAVLAILIVLEIMAARHRAHFAPTYVINACDRTPTGMLRLVGLQSTFDHYFAIILIATGSRSLSNLT